MIYIWSEAISTCSEPQQNQRLITYRCEGMVIFIKTLSQHIKFEILIYKWSEHLIELRCEQLKVLHASLRIWGPPFHVPNILELSS